MFCKRRHIKNPTCFGQIEGIQPQTPKKTNDEAGSWKVVNALGTKDDP
jgi:hypothetical protein